MKKKLILRHCDLDFDPRSPISIGFKWGKQPFSENRVQFSSSVRLEFCSQEEPYTHTQTDRQTHRHTDTQTNCSENVAPPRFCGGVKHF